MLTWIAVLVGGGVPGSDPGEGPPLQVLRLDFKANHTVDIVSRL